MLNKEKYAKQIIEFACEGYSIAVVAGKPQPCGETSCKMCDLGGGCTSNFKKWANSEYVEPVEPSVDWSKVPVDTPIFVRDRNDCIWRKRYFTKFENGHVRAWDDGRTSWSDGKGTTMWDHAKLAESEE